MVIPYMPMLIPPICWTGSVFVAYFLHWLSYDASYKLDSTYGLELWLFFWYYYLHNVATFILVQRLVLVYTNRFCLIRLLLLSLCISG